MFRKFLKEFDWSWQSILKVAGTLILGAVVLALVIGMVGGALKSILGGVGYGYRDEVSSGGMNVLQRAIGEVTGIGGGSSHGVMPTKANSVSADYAVGYGAEDGYWMEESMPPIYPAPQGGVDAEKYEVQEYTAYYEKGNSEEICDTVEGLKPLSHVVFDSSNRSETGDSCWYSFRVERERADEVIAILKELDPREWNDNSYTIENSVSGTEFELALLNDRLDALTETINQTEEAYSDLVQIATNRGDVESLTQIIDNRINTLNRLNEQKRNTLEQIERYGRTGVQQEDQISYAHFSVSVQERKIVDWRNIGDSWINALRDLARDINNTLQGLVLGLISFVLAVVKALVYLGVLLVIVKIAWIGARRIWKWEPLK